MENNQMEVVHLSNESEFDKFIAWVEGINLFRLICDNPNATRIEGVTDKEMFILNRNNTIIEHASDLPIEILFNFVNNYPNYHQMFIEERSKPSDLKFKLFKMIVDDNFTIEDVIDVVVEANAIIGVGLISLGEILHKYCINKIRK